MLSISYPASLPNGAVKGSYVFFMVLAAFVFNTHNINAQSSSKKPASKKSIGSYNNKLEAGVSGGLSLNYFNTGQPQTGLNTGYIGGLSVNYSLYKGFGVQIEANYLQQGGRMVRFKDDTRFGLPESFESKNVKNSSYKLNSVEIPLLINYAFQLRQSWQPSLYVGGSYAHAFNASENYQKTGNLLPGEDIISTVSGSQNSSELFKSNRYNFIAGANVKLPLTSRVKLLLDFRYLAGLTAVRENYSYMEKTGFGTDVRANSCISKVGVVISIK